MNLLIFAGKSRKQKKLDNTSTTTSSTISSSWMWEIIDWLKWNQHRTSTKHNYHTIWKLFSKFVFQIDQRPVTWEDKILLFTGFLIDRGKQSSTVKSYISAVEAILQADDKKVHEDRVLLSSLTRACHLQNNRIATKLPIRRDLLNLIIKHLPEIFTTEEPYLITLYWAVFSTAYFGLFRILEVAQTASNHAVKACDVHTAVNKKKMMFILRTSKTHGLGDKPQIIKFSSKDGYQKMSAMRLPGNCPYQLLNDFIDIRQKWKRVDENLFIFSDGSPVNAMHLRVILKKSLKTFRLTCNSIPGTQLGLEGQQIWCTWVYRSRQKRI